MDDLRAESAVLSLAESVAEGHAIDWALAHSGSTNDVELLEQLQIIEAVARMHRTQPIVETPAPATARPATLNPGDRWQHLEIIERVGGGTFGDVYRARDTHLDRDVALKLLRRRAQSEALASQILTEGRLLARVQHPSVITIYGAESVNGQVGLWMEFIRGFTLEDLLAQQGAYSPREVTFIGLDLCRALAAVHATGLVHRDIKAANVMREQGGRIVLMDFGTGQDLNHTGPEGRMAGTPLYLAPEIFKGEAATVRSDLYSLGVLLYRMATGAYPVNGATLRDLADAHRAGKFVRMRDVRPTLPNAFVNIIERALSPNPEHRFESAGAMDSALAAWLGIRGTGSELSEGSAKPASPYGEQSVSRGSGRAEPSAVRSASPADQSVARGAAEAEPSVARGFSRAWIAALVVLAIAGGSYALLRRPAAPRPPAGAAAPAPIQSIAVLPLANLGGASPSSPTSR